MSDTAFSLDSLKNKTLNGYLIFTDAVETGEDRGEYILLTNNTRPGIDVALMEIGFVFNPDMSQPAKNFYWMKRGEKEALRYYPTPDKGTPMFGLAHEHGLKTRIDFFCHESGSAVYDVVEALLKFGYKAMVFPPEQRVVQDLYLIEPDENGNPMISRIP